VKASTPTSAQGKLQKTGSPTDVSMEVTSRLGIFVAWNPPSVDASCDYEGDGGSPVTHYTVEWDVTPTFDSPSSKAVVDAQDGTFYQIGGRNPMTGVESNILDLNETYYVRVTAFNELGSSDPKVSTPASVSLQDQVPDGPSNVQLRVDSATSLFAYWDAPLRDGGRTLDGYLVSWEESRTNLDSMKDELFLPMIHEIQSVELTTDVSNEQQHIRALTKVRNERQTVRSLVTGIDEIQTVTLASDAVLPDIQTITTHFEGDTTMDEIQTLEFMGDDVNEIQVIQTYSDDEPEVQRVSIEADRVNEKQFVGVIFQYVNTSICDSLTSCDEFVSNIEGRM
jgi:hypothetical protein